MAREPAQREGRAVAADAKLARGCANALIDKATTANGREEPGMVDPAAQSCPGTNQASSKRRGTATGQDIRRKGYLSEPTNHTILCLSSSTGPYMLCSQSSSGLR